MFINIYIVKSADGLKEEMISDTSKVAESVNPQVGVGSLDHCDRTVMMG